MSTACSAYGRLSHRAARKALAPLVVQFGVALLPAWIRYVQCAIEPNRLFQAHTCSPRGSNWIAFAKFMNITFESLFIIMIFYIYTIWIQHNMIIDVITFYLAVIVGHIIEHYNLLQIVQIPY